MIRVTVELVPGGRGEPQHLATVSIANRSGLADVSNYAVRVYGKKYQHLEKRDAHVRGHRRLATPVLTLVRRALQEAGY